MACNRVSGSFTFTRNSTNLCEAQAILVHEIMKIGAVTLPSSPQSPLPVATVADPHEVYPNQPKLPCIVFLKTHFEHGGVDKKGYDMLHRMIEMMSATGREVHVIFQSKIACRTSLVNMDQYLSCIVQGCDTFNKRMRATVRKTSRAADSLPGLGDLIGDKLERRLKQWRWKLK